MIRKSFNDNWTFIKNGEEVKVNLPHDAMIYEKRSDSGKTGVGGAYFEGGFYTYKKSYMVPEELKDNTVYLEVLGAYRNSKVYLNGILLNEHKYGYTPYFVELTENLKYGSANTFEITCDNTEVPNSRWYSGAGLYRGLNLIIGGKTHFDIENIKVMTLSINPITIKYEAPHTGNKTIKVEIEIYDSNTLIKKDSGVSKMLNVDAKLWDTTNPKMYQIKFTLFDGNTILDSYTMDYGFRTISYSTNGFFLNGEKTILKGACIHHDNGILGAISLYDAEVKKLKTLKKAGFNAIRSAHNPASDALLKACDDLGFLVMDELTDMWLYHKTPYDYATDFKYNYMDDLKAMVKRDYNHPSVIMYSLGNELASPTSYNKEALKILKDLVDYIHEYDYRPSTMAINFTNLERPELMSHKKKWRMDEVYSNSDTLVDDYNDVIVKLGLGMAEIACAKDSEDCSIETFKILDLAGYNYAYKRYELDNKIHKDRIIVGTETMNKDVYENYKRMQMYPQVIGDFVWTGIDYLGEVGIGGYYSFDHHFEKRYPWILANGGAFDLLGNPTGEAFLAGITYGTYRLKIATQKVLEDEVLSAWRYTNTRETYSYKKEDIGKLIRAEVYSIYPYTELFLNGKSLGRKENTLGYTTYEFLYEEGTLKAVGSSNNNDTNSEVCILKSAEESKLNLRVDYKGKDITYIYAEYKDLYGTIDTKREDLLTAKIEGGIILGFGSANPVTEDNYTFNTCHAWMGVAQIIIKKTDKNTILSISDSSFTETIKF